MIKTVTKISDGVNKCCEALLVTSGVLFVVIMTLQIVFRYALGHSLSWSESAARYLFIYGTMLAAPVAIKNGGHIVLTFITDKFRGKALIVVEIIILLICVVLCCYATKAGIAAVNLVKAQKAAALPIKMSAVYISVPIGMILAAFQLICEMIVKLGKLFGKEETEE